jgi:hypothetical protein
MNHGPGAFRQALALLGFCLAREQCLIFGCGQLLPAWVVTPISVSRILTEPVSPQVFAVAAR